MGAVGRHEICSYERMGDGMGSCLRRNDGGWGLAEVGDYLLG